MKILDITVAELAGVTSYNIEIATNDHGEQVFLVNKVSHLPSGKSTSIILEVETLLEAKAVIVRLVGGLIGIPISKEAVQ
jgi:hypothetical protein